MLKTTVVYVTHDQIEAMTLATRIAVMRDGRIEQLGTPDEIYNIPATLYVATFVGAPPMNLLNATVADGGLRIDGTSTVLPLPAAAVKLGQGHELVFGIRPEALRLAEPGAFEAICEVAELTGPEMIVTAQLGAHRLMAALPPRTAVATGQRIGLNFDPEALHLFDRASGRRCG
jgi:multiple sugar transport system ATP-binding protein